MHCFLYNFPGGEAELDREIGRFEFAYGEITRGTHGWGYYCLSTRWGGFESVSSAHSQGIFQVGIGSAKLSFVS